MNAIAELIAPASKQQHDFQVRHIVIKDVAIELEFSMEKPHHLVPGPLLFGALPDRRLRLKKPIPVELSESDGSIIAQCQDLNEFGQGSTASHALDDFGRTITELFLSLEAQKDQLGSDLQNLRSRLAEYLAEDSAVA